MHYLKFQQKLPISLEQAWEFFSSPANLKIITPDYLRFEMTSQDERKEMYPGQIITYRIRPLLNIPMQWVSEITHCQKPLYFIDEQRFGPYTFWHHQHRFQAIPGGIEMVDIVHYKLPMGPIGNLINALKVRRDLEKIFAFRQVKLDQIFGKFRS